MEVENNNYLQILVWYMHKGVAGISQPLLFHRIPPILYVGIERQLQSWKKNEIKLSIRSSKNVIKFVS